MARNVRLSTLAFEILDLIRTRFYNAKIRIYSGTQPEDPFADIDTGAGGHTLLAELVFGSSGYTAPTSTANSVTTIGGTATVIPVGDNSANNSGTATWFRVLKSDGTTKLFDGSIGTSDADMIMPSVEITAGNPVAITGITLTIPRFVA